MGRLWRIQEDLVLKIALRYHVRAHMKARFCRRRHWFHALSFDL